MNSEQWFDKLTEKQLYDMGYNSASGLDPELSVLDIIPDGMFATLPGLYFCNGFDDYRLGLPPRKF